MGHLNLGSLVQLRPIWDNCCAVAFDDWGEIGDERLKLHFIFEWFGTDEGIHVGLSTVPDHPLMLDCGHGILFRVHAKWVRKVRRLKKLGWSSRLGEFATSVLTVS
jgi:hypothetical protein